ncbi:hypothetical protein FOCC_FOCC000581 [Frankliniella occidentalis]|nr:hypothetical protein FOCC_FOCC000581 [Frankliniella occidentalis]
MNFRIPEAPQGVNFNHWVRDVITSLLEQSWVGAGDDDRVGLTVTLPDTPEGVFHIPLVLKRDLHPDLILDRIEALSQSNMAVFLAGDVTVEFICSESPVGGSIRRSALLMCDMKTFAAHKYGLYEPKKEVEANDCLIHAVAAGWVWNQSPEEFQKNLKRKIPFEKERRILIQESQIRFPRAGCGLEELRALQRCLDRRDPGQYNLVLVGDRLAKFSDYSSDEGEREGGGRGSDSGSDSEAPRQKRQKRKKRKPAKPWCLITYDLETRQDRQLREGVWLHEPILCVSQTSCLRCMASNDLTLTCRWCGPRERVFKGADCIEQFMHYVFNDEKLLKFASLTLCAHNASGFDNIPILDFLTQRPCFAKSSPSIIMRGTRIVEIKMGRVRMVDSLNYLSMKLSALPKALGLGVDVKKGWFPHHFSQHSGYVGPIPPKEMYGVDKMSVAERAEFEAWYATQQDVVFDLDRELLEYCRMDVTILRLACLRFRELYLAVASVDPFRECCTLASCCMLTYRANYLNPSTIALLPECGYFGVDRQSKVALEWLQWYSHEHNIELQHAGNGREVKVGRFRVDGMNADQKLVLEFLGCWWHGCRACFSARTAVIGHEKKNNEDTMDARLKRTQERRELLEAQGYTVVSMWECEWKRQKQMDAEVSAFVEAHPVALEDPLDPREAFYGGRTNNTKLYCAAGPDEMICYADICSLYPYKLVLGEIESIRIESKKDIRRDGRFHILSKDTHKILKPVYTKRQRHPRSHEEMYKYDTIPYGYKEG